MANEVLFELASASETDVHIEKLSKYIEFGDKLCKSAEGWSKIRNEANETVFHVAAKTGNVLFLALLHARAPNQDEFYRNLALQDDLKRTPLHCAILHDQERTVLWLARHGANLCLQDIYGNTCLHLAICVCNEYILSIICLALLFDEWYQPLPRSYTTISDFFWGPTGPRWVSRPSTALTILFLSAFRRRHTCLTLFYIFSIRNTSGYTPLDLAHISLYSRDKIPAVLGLSPSSTINSATTHSIGSTAQAMFTRSTATNSPPAYLQDTSVLKRLQIWMYIRSVVATLRLRACCGLQFDPSLRSSATASSGSLTSSPESNTTSTLRTFLTTSSSSTTSSHTTNSRNTLDTIDASIKSSFPRAPTTHQTSCLSGLKWTLGMMYTICRHPIETGIAECFWLVNQAWDSLFSHFWLIASTWCFLGYWLYLQPQLQYILDLLDESAEPSGAIRDLDISPGPTSQWCPSGNALACLEPVIQAFRESFVSMFLIPTPRNLRFLLLGLMYGLACCSNLTSIMYIRIKMLGHLIPKPDHIPHHMRPRLSSVQSRLPRPLSILPSPPFHNTSSSVSISDIKVSDSSPSLRQSSPGSPFAEDGDRSPLENTIINGSMSNVTTATRDNINAPDAYYPALSPTFSYSVSPSMRRKGYLMYTSSTGDEVLAPDTLPPDFDLDAYGAIAPLYPATDAHAPSNTQSVQTPSHSQPKSTTATSGTPLNLPINSSFPSGQPSRPCSLPSMASCVDPPGADAYNTSTSHCVQAPVAACADSRTRYLQLTSMAPDTLESDLRNAARALILDTLNRRHSPDTDLSAFSAPSLSINPSMANNRASRAFVYNTACGTGTDTRHVLCHPVLRPLREYYYKYLTTRHLPDTDQYDYCALCDMTQLPGTKHCDYCGVCSHGYNHHSFWLSSCIGYENHAVFYLFMVFATSTFVLWTLTLLVYYDFTPAMGFLQDAKSQEMSSTCTVFSFSCMFTPVLLTQKMVQATGTMLHIMQHPIFFLLSVQPIWIGIIGTYLILTHTWQILTNSTSISGKKRTFLVHEEYEAIGETSSGGQRGSPDRCFRSRRLGMMVRRIKRPAQNWWYFWSRATILPSLREIPRFVKFYTAEYVPVLTPIMRTILKYLFNIGIATYAIASFFFNTFFKSIVYIVWRCNKRRRRKAQTLPD